MRTLGRLFTFVLRIRSNHELIRTGPYAFVRHPSYTGLYLESFGSMLLLQSGPTVACLLTNASLEPHFTVPWILAFFSTYLTFHTVMRERMRREETMLAAEFREDWDAYGRDVPFRLFPYIW